jgi:hypothetical protein
MDGVQPSDFGVKNKLCRVNMISILKWACVVCLHTMSLLLGFAASAHYLFHIIE